MYKAECMYRDMDAEVCLNVYTGMDMFVSVCVFVRLNMVSVRVCTCICQ